MTLSYEQIQNLSKVDRIKYYSQSKFYSLKEYDFNIVYKFNPDYDTGYTDIVDYNFDNIFTLNHGYKILKAYDQAFEERDHRRLFHILSILYNLDCSEQNLDKVLHPNSYVSNYTNKRYFRDATIEERRQIFEALGKTKKRLKFIEGEYEDLANMLRAKKYANESVLQYIKKIYTNPDFFRNTKYYKEVKRKRTPDKAIQNAIFSIKHRSPKTIETIIKYIGIQKLQQVIKQLDEHDISHVTSCLHGEVYQKFVRARASCSDIR